MRGMGAVRAGCESLPLFAEHARTPMGSKNHSDSHGRHPIILALPGPKSRRCSYAHADAAMRVSRRLQEAPDDAMATPPTSPLASHTGDFRRQLQCTQVALGNSCESGARYSWSTSAATLRRVRSIHLAEAGQPPQSNRAAASFSRQIQPPFSAATRYYRRSTIQDSSTTYLTFGYALMMNSKLEVSSDLEQKNPLRTMRPRGFFGSLAKACMR